MAQRVITRLVDDLDGSELAEGRGKTVRFGFDGVSHEIDLSEKNAKKLKQTLDPYAPGGSKGRTRRQVAVLGGA